MISLQHPVLIRFTNKQNIVLEILVFSIIVIAAVFLFSISPYYQPYPGRDSGIFLYIGKSILSGKMPYVDVWDHKPPLIYFIDALGLLLLNNDRWGVWLLEVISLLTSVFLSINFYRKVAGIEVSLIVTFIWLSTCISLFEGGNLTEEFALPFQFGLLSLVYFGKPKHEQKGLVLGILLSVCFLFKPNVIGIGFVIFFVYIYHYIVKRDNIQLIRFFIGFLIGFFLPLSLTAVYFQSSEHLRSAWNAIFVYNTNYVEEANLLQRFEGIARLLSYGIPSGLVIFCVLGWFNSIKKLNRKGINTTEKLLEYVFIFSFILDLVLVSVSGRSYRHYMISMLPVLSFGACYGIVHFLPKLESIHINKLTFIVLTLVVNGLLFSYNFSIESNIFKNWGSSELVSTIKSKAPEGSNVLIWGNEVGYNFLTKTNSPTEFIYQYPIRDCNEFSRRILKTVVSDLKKTPTDLIIDASSSTLYAVPSLGTFDLTEKNCVLLSEDVLSLREYISSNYRSMDVIHDREEKYVIYVRK